MMRWPAALAFFVAVAVAAPAALAQHVHDETSPPGEAPPSEPLPPFVPPVTDAMRAAAFPDVGDHGVHPESTHVFVLADHFEWVSGDDTALATEITGWIGRDLDRLWFRAEGAVDARAVHDGRLEVFYGRAVSRWWDVVAGVRTDVRSGPTRTWAAVGIQGLAPHWFEVDATVYVGSGARTSMRLSADYELLVTNRLVLQPSATLDLAGKADPERRLGAGVTGMETGLRLRYEITREFAPYVGVVWQRALGDTAAMRREDGGAAADRQVVVGVRLWH